MGLFLGTFLLPSWAGPAVCAACSVFGRELPCRRTCTAWLVGQGSPAVLVLFKVVLGPGYSNWRANKRGAIRDAHQGQPAL